MEQLQKNGFLFLESNIKKKRNDEESLYDSYDDGIPIKFLINKGRLDFSKIMYESTEKMKLTILNNKYNEENYIYIMISFISLKSMAGDGDKFLIRRLAMEKYRQCSCRGWSLKVNITMDNYILI